MKFVIVGHGKMGRAIEARAVGRGHVCCARFDLDDAATIDRERLGDAEVAFEFTRPDAAEENVRRLLSAGVSVVCGTTGWTPGNELEALARETRTAAVIAANFSIGMNLFYRLVRQAGELLGAAGQHEPWVHEAHHSEKRDVPSGTARHLAGLLLRSDPRLQAIHEGNPTEPLPREVLHVASVRAGHEPGTHTVGFDGEHDTIVLRHAARSRDGFAHGAVLAAEWVPGHSGLHSFEPVIDALLKDGLE